MLSPGIAGANIRDESGATTRSSATPRSRRRSDDGQHRGEAERRGRRTGERAFATFTQRMVDFKPREHTLLHSPVVDTIFEPRVGGNILDRGEAVRVPVGPHPGLPSPPRWCSLGHRPHLAIEDEPELTSEVEGSSSPMARSELASNSSTQHRSTRTGLAGGARWSRGSPRLAAVPGPVCGAPPGGHRLSVRARCPGTGPARFSPVTRRPRDQFLHRHDGSMPVEMSRDDFEDLVARRSTSFPEQFTKAMDNVVMLVADRHPTRTSTGCTTGWRSPAHLVELSGHLPDTITIYREPILAHARNRGRGQGPGGHHGDP